MCYVEVLIYFAIGILFSGITNGILKVITGDGYDNPLALILFAVCWPICILIGILYGCAKIISLVVEFIGESL